MEETKRAGKSGVRDEIEGWAPELSTASLRALVGRGRESGGYVRKLSCTFLIIFQPPFHLNFHAVI